MSTDEPTLDYTTMSGAQFMRAVAADPSKWAEAYLQVVPMSPLTREEHLALLTQWFGDAMTAAVQHALRVLPRP